MKTAGNLDLRAVRTCAALRPNQYGTPKDIIAKLNSEILKALKSPDIASFIGGDGGEPVGSTPEALAAMFKREVERYAKIIKAADTKSE